MKLLFESWRKYLEENGELIKEAFPVPPEFFRYVSRNIPSREEKDDVQGGIHVFPYQIYCDMDGVLVDLISRVLEKSYNDPNNQALRKKVEKIIGTGWRWRKKHPKYQKALNYINDMVSNNVEFWSELPSMPDKNTLWSYISKYDPIILSHPWDEASSEGKRLWIEKNLDPQPKDVILTGNKHKWALSDSERPNILIDDFEKYTIPWEKSGGIAILHTQAEDTLAKLENIKNEADI